MIDRSVFDQAVRDIYDKRFKYQAPSIQQRNQKVAYSYTKTEGEPPLKYPVAWCKQHERLETFPGCPVEKKAK